MDIVLAAETGGGYVAAAYLTFVILLVIYVAIMAKKLTRLQNSLSEIRQKLDGDDAEGS